MSIRRIWTSLLAVLLLPYASASAATCNDIAGLKSNESTQPTEIIFQNSSDKDRKLYWVDYDGSEQFYDTLPSGTSYRQSTATNHYWVIRDAGETCMYVIEVGEKPIVAEIGFEPDTLAGATFTNSKSDAAFDPEAGNAPTNNDSQAHDETVVPPVASHADPADIVSPIETFELQGHYRLATRLEPKKFLRNTSDGRPSQVTARSNSFSLQWLFEDVPDTTYVRLRNRWKSTYLVDGEDGVTTADVPASDERSHWAMESVEGEPFVWLVSRVSGDVLAAEAGAVRIATLDDSDRSGHWQLAPADRGIAPASRSTPALTRDTVTCEGGTYSGGKCWCPSGMVRVQNDDWAYECVTKTVRRRSGCIGGSWIDGSCACPFGRHFREGTCVSRATFINGCFEAGYNYHAGRCVLDCPAGTYDRDGYCERGTYRCPAGTFYNGEGCEPECGPGREWVGGWCEWIDAGRGPGGRRCPSGWRTGDGGCIWPDVYGPGALTITYFGSRWRPGCPGLLVWNRSLGACSAPASVLGINIIINKQKFGHRRGFRRRPPRGPIAKTKVIVLQPKILKRKKAKKNARKGKRNAKIKNTIAPAFVPAATVGKRGKANSAKGKGKNAKSKGKGKSKNAKAANRGAGAGTLSPVAKATPNATLTPGNGKRKTKGEGPAKLRKKAKGSGKREGKGRKAKADTSAPPPPIVKQVRTQDSAAGKASSTATKKGLKSKNGKKSSKKKVGKPKKATATLTPQKASNSNAKPASKNIKKSRKAPAAKNKPKPKKKAKAGVGAAKPKTVRKKSKKLKKPKPKAKTKAASLKAGNKTKKKKAKKNKKAAPKVVKAKSVGDAAKKPAKKTKKNKKKKAEAKKSTAQ